MKASNQWRNINPRRLDYFHGVMTHGSIVGAADSMNTAPSVVTRQIQLLERELEVTLFERRARLGMKPTEAAEVVLEYYRGSRAQQDHMEACLQELRSMQRGSVSIAVPNAYIEALMEEVLNDYYLKYPGLTVCIEEVKTSPQVVTKVLEDIAHVGITFFNPLIESNIRHYLRAPLPICMLVSPNHSLAARRKMTFLEAADYPLALPPVSFSLRQMIQSVERAEKIQLTPAFISDSTSAQKKFACVGLGGTFMSTFAARQEIKNGQQVALEIDHPVFMSAESCLIVRQGRPLSPAVTQLLRLLAAKLSIFAHDRLIETESKTQ